MLPAVRSAKKWDIITIGNVSRNAYWGESEDHPYRRVICTSTLITGEGFRLLVDPPHVDHALMTTDLDRRSGIALKDVSAVFVTHEHGDHHAGLAHFPHADWFAAPPVADAINATTQYEKHIEPVEINFLGAFGVIATPGHTASHHSLRFECDGVSVVIAGDAVMTRAHWFDRRGSWNSTNLILAAESIGRLTQIADIVVPGHDNYFTVDNGGRVMTVPYYPRI